MRERHAGQGRGMTVRVGHIEFLNCFPLYYGFERTGMLADDRRIDRPGRPGVELLPGVPTELNRMLAAGRDRPGSGQLHRLRAQPSPACCSRAA